MSRPDWSREGPTWPNREASRFVRTRATRWHVQVTGKGPDLLLLHGTGASTHSWAPIVPYLAEHFRLVMVDLPAHGFTAPLPGGSMKLERLVEALHQLLDALEYHAALHHRSFGGCGDCVPVAARYRTRGRDAGAEWRVVSALAPCSIHSAGTAQAIHGQSAAAAHPFGPCVGSDGRPDPRQHRFAHSGTATRTLSQAVPVFGSS